MKFLLAADNFTRGSGGAPRSAQDLVRTLLGAGHRVAVIEEGRPGGKENWNGADLFRARLHGPLMPGDRDLRTLLLNPRWREEVRALAEAFGPDLVITQGMLAPGALQAAGDLYLRSAYFFRGYGPFCPVQFMGRDPQTCCIRPRCWKCLPPARRIKYPLINDVLDLYRSTVPQADLLVANSRYIAGIFERFWDCRAQVVLPTVGITAAAAPENDPEGYLLFIKPQKIKGLNILLELARRMPERSFAVAGETRGSARRALEKLSNVKLLGWCEDMGAVYRGARALLGPSLWPEPFGRVFSEAAAVGCPSIAFDCGGIPEAAGEGGLLLPRDSTADDWIAAVKSLDDPARYQSLRRGAIGHARRLSSSDQKTRALRLLEETALRGPRPRPAPPDPGRKLKVAHLISALPVGGAELSLFHLASRMNRDRFETEIICLRDEGALAGRFRSAGIPVTLRRLASRYSPIGLLGLARRLAAGEVDVVHTHLRRPNTSGRIAAWLADTPVIIAHERNPGPEKSWRHFMIDRLLARVSSAVIAVSRHTAERNSALSGIPLDRFRVVPNAVDLDQFRPGDRAAARGRLNIDPGEFVLGFAGRLHPVKKLEVLLRGFASAGLNNSRLLLVGDGPLRIELESLSQELKIRERVTFLGTRSDMPGIYPAMDALALVSESEGCSRVMLEAAACGLPLILTPVGHAPAFARSRNDCAVMVPVGEHGPLSAAVMKLAADADLRDKMGRAARIAAAPHGLDRYVRDMERLYLELFAANRD